jgi:hypothetical protein
LLKYGNWILFTALHDMIEEEEEEEEEEDVYILNPLLYLCF